MADIINLRRARKHKARADKERQADANRKKHGLTMHEKQSAKHERFVDGHRRDEAGE